MAWRDQVEPDGCGCSTTTFMTFETIVLRPFRPVFLWVMKTKLLAVALVCFSPLGKHSIRADLHYFSDVWPRKMLIRIAASQHTVHHRVQILNLAFEASNSLRIEGHRDDS